MNGVQEPGPPSLSPAPIRIVGAGVSTCAPFALPLFRSPRRPRDDPRGPPPRPPPRRRPPVRRERAAGPARRTAELSWLLSRGYADVSALKLVGDRHELTVRQRQAVSRCACSDAARDARVAARARPAPSSPTSPSPIDGLNCLIILESALSHGIVLRGRDGALRDLASVHGTYRQVAETSFAIEMIGRHLHASEHAPSSEVPGTSTARSPTAAVCAPSCSRSPSSAAGPGPASWSTTPTPS
jgi:hypothetical protein